MKIDWVLAAILAGVVVLIALGIAIDGGRRSPGRFPFATWIGATLVTLVAGAVAAFVIGAGLVVVLGPNGGGMIGLGLAATILVVAPIAWALFFRSRAHQASVKR
jgi:hypothetical protein